MKKAEKILHLYLGCEAEIKNEEASIRDKITPSTLLMKNIWDVKPILRPLSDLVKEIEVDGEKFVPMKKLHEMYETNYFSDDEIIKYIKYVDRIISCEHCIYKYSGGEDFILKYIVPTTNMGELVYSFTYDPKLKRFAIRDETHKKPLGVGYQIDMFLKLLEWEFDIFELIKSGEAIEKK